MEYRVKVGEKIHVFDADRPDQSGSFSVESDAGRTDLQVIAISSDHLHVRSDRGSMNVYFASAGDGDWVWIDGKARFVQDADKVVQRRSRGGAGSGPSAVTPPTPATVMRVLTEVGAVVKKGDPMVVVSAMKMEITLSAPYDGVVTAVNTEEGASVSPGEILVDIEKTTEGEDGE